MKKPEYTVLNKYRHVVLFPNDGSLRYKIFRKLYETLIMPFDHGRSYFDFKKFLYFRLNNKTVAFRILFVLGALSAYIENAVGIMMLCVVSILVIGEFLMVFYWLIKLIINPT